MKYPKDFTREDYVEMVKLAAKEIEEHADEYIGPEEFEGELTISFTIFYGLNEATTINIERTKLSHKIRDYILEG